MQNCLEYMKVFLKYEADDMPVVFFYEVDINNERLMLRTIEVFADRQVKLDADPYREAIEIGPIPTAAELNAKVWGDGFFATNISKEEFERIWETGTYDDKLSVD